MPLDCARGDNTAIIIATTESLAAERQARQIVVSL